MQDPLGDLVVVDDLDAAALEGGACDQRQPRRQGRRQLFILVQPVTENDRKHPVLREVVEILVKGFDRVEIALSQQVGAGRLGGEGIDRRDLDQVILLASRSHEMPAFGCDQFHLRPLKLASGPLAQHRVVESNRDRLEFRAGHPGGALVEGVQD